MSNEPRGTVLKVGPYATSRVEPRQTRKGATVRRFARVPWEYLTGAGSAWRSRDGRFEGGCTVLVNWFRGGASAGHAEGWLGSPSAAPHTAIPGS